MMELSFTVNTTEKLFTKWLEERAKTMEAPRFGISEGNKLLHLMSPTWGNALLKIQPNRFVVCGSYTYYKPNGDVDYVEGALGRPFIAFNFYQLSTERIDVNISIDDSEPLVILYATLLLRLIEKKYPETHDALKPYLNAQAQTKIEIDRNQQGEPVGQKSVFKEAKQLGIRPHRLDRWKEIVKLRDDGLTQEKIAEKLSVSLDTIKIDYRDMRRKGYIAG